MYLFWISLIIASSLYAQGSPKLSLLERLAQPKVSIESSYLHDANVASSEATVRTSKLKFTVNNAFAGFSYSHWDFEWDKADSLPFGKGSAQPIDGMHRFKLDLRYAHKFNTKWFMLASVSATSTFEKEMSDSYGSNLFVFGSYSIDADHTVQFGAFANYHPIKTLALPVISYSYRARQSDGLQVVLGFPRAYIGYHINEKLLFNAGIVYSQAVIRLADESTIASKGFLESKDYMGNFGMKYDVSDQFIVVTDLLISFSREFSIYESNGDKDNNYYIDSSLGALVKLRYIF